MLTTEEYIQQVHQALDDFRVAAMKSINAGMIAFQPLFDAYEQANQKPVIDRRKLSQRRSRRRTNKK